MKYFFIACFIVFNQFCSACNFIDVSYQNKSIGLVQANNQIFSSQGVKLSKLDQFNSLVCKTDLIFPGEVEPFNIQIRLKYSPDILSFKISEELGWKEIKILDVDDHKYFVENQFWYFTQNYGGAVLFDFGKKIIKLREDGSSYVCK